MDLPRTIVGVGLGRAEVVAEGRVVEWRRGRGVETKAMVKRRFYGA